MNESVVMSHLSGIFTRIIGFFMRIIFSLGPRPIFF